MADWQDFTYTSCDGLKLFGRKYGWHNRDAMPVVCLSGLSRNSIDFHDVAVHLSQHADIRRRVLCLDYRGRGNSAYDKNWENYNIVTEADDVVQGMNAAGLEHADFIGTSRGGLILMVLAAMKPVLLNSVILNDVGPEIDGPGLVSIKKRLESSGPVRDWKEATASMKEAGEKHFPTRDDKEWEKQARLTFIEKDGALAPNFDPNLLNTLKAIDLDVRLPSLWPQFVGLSKIPTLLIRGDNTNLLAKATVERMSDIHRDMKIINVANQGHAPDLGSGNLPEKIEAFLDQ